MHTMGMHDMPRISALILGLSLAAGCSRSSPDTAPPDDGDYDDDVSGVVDDEAPVSRPMRVTGVYLDPALTAVCELDKIDEVVEFDADSQDDKLRGTLAQVAQCVKFGPLQGRRIELVGHTGARDDEFRTRYGKTRVEAVRSLLAADGVPEGDIVSKPAEPEDDPEAARAWPSERRVDVRVATRHAR